MFILMFPYSNIPPERRSLKKRLNSFCVSGKALAPSKDPQPAPQRLLSGGATSRFHVPGRDSGKSCTPQRTLKNQEDIRHEDLIVSSPPTTLSRKTTRQQPGLSPHAQRLAGSGRNHPAPTPADVNRCSSWYLSP